ncbi:Acyl-coenzyme A diphosphatase NUDT19 [Acropora cervicornis]|uniref:Acyl-coenzyme A diphosphatase NUDT19 n=1 Tax=Acropora cervicornis TaxID=6130 RepID=A0AAD9VAX9_ACRCE|nr:Acyl-coenzyme A diphosphatase NUDT19 [Acropora cervicornis]
MPQSKEQGLELLHWGIVGVNVSPKWSSGKMLHNLPNKYVFPGGVVEEKADFSNDWMQLFKRSFSEFGADFAPLVNIRGPRPPLLRKSTTDIPSEVGLRICAIRETFEESGILLLRSLTNKQHTQLDLQDVQNWRKQVYADPLNFFIMCRELECVPDVWSLSEWSNWLTPTSFTRRYDTLFYISFLEKEPAVFLDDKEMIHSKELLPHDDQYPSESEKVLKELINSSTGTVSLTEVPYTIEEWLCNNSHGSNFNRISHKFGDSLSYRVTSNVSLPQVGVLYGTTSVAVGHPFDTIKTKMQAQKGFEHEGMIRTFARTVKAQGIRGLYKGSIPPLWGSGIYRSTQFAVFEALYTYFNGFGRQEIPLTGGLQVRVLLAGAAASTARAIIETPLELAKIRRQTGQTWQFKGLYRGFGVTWYRTMGLMCTYFILLDSGRRKFPDLFRRPILGPFLTSGIAATDLPVVVRMRLVIKERGGLSGLYRGIVPGSIRSFMSNGTSMIAMSWAQRKVSQWGLRG